MLIILEGNRILLSSSYHFSILRCFPSLKRNVNMKTNKFKATYEIRAVQTKTSKFYYVRVCACVGPTYKAVS